MLTYEEHDIKLWIVNTETFYNLVKNNLNDYGTFKTIVYSIYLHLKNRDLLNDEFDLKELNFYKLFEDLKEYFL